ncbi:hypothetical protein C9374_001391 [Naegleria lovaniensis]|uniref:Uncharacterized protein n=1 Tax=Naegleria lovaniensis TaxID=51637 RepID=A0AA88GVK4_NAELO|nr:uncharacterized protein C9374_013750 [Naegleria lovaniensis]XP_044551789.1 uncharacterized protein C9374_001391 [Naegleria lovaniensis]KAG2370875.1 hypothetical protein C9374_013750 [Naegleria lovaniensis]KAG2387797.1 hypothetical protein C9374_001391 [Naegleria lovaniensis]
MSELTANYLLSRPIGSLDDTKAFQLCENSTTSSKIESGMVVQFNSALYGVFCFTTNGSSIPTALCFDIGLLEEIDTHKECRDRFHFISVDKLAVVSDPQQATLSEEKFSRIEPFVFNTFKIQHETVRAETTHIPDPSRMTTRSMSKQAQDVEKEQQTTHKQQTQESNPTENEKKQKSKKSTKKQPKKTSSSKTKKNEINDDEVEPQKKKTRPIQETKAELKKRIQQSEEYIQELKEELRKEKQKREKQQDEIEILAHTIKHLTSESKEPTNEKQPTSNSTNNVLSSQPTLSTQQPPIVVMMQPPQPQQSPPGFLPVMPLPQFQENAYTDLWYKLGLVPRWPFQH